MSDETKIPKVGDPLNMIVHQSPTRTTLFPEQFVVVTRVNAVQVMMLRMEPIPVAQEGEVKEVDLAAGTFDFHATRTRVEGQLVDLGHFIVGTDGGRELVKLLFKTLVQNHGMDAKALVDELTDELSTAK